MKRRLSIIVPCFNEEELIYPCLNSIVDVGLPMEVLVVDDGSKDKTVDIAQRKKIDFKVPVKIIRIPENCGKAKAVAKGVAEAEGEIIVVHDADMFVKKEVLAHFYELLKDGKADVVIGSRFSCFREKRAMKIVNIIGNMILARVFSLLTGQKFTDILCGLKAFKKKDFLKMEQSRCRWGDLDLLINSHKLGLKVSEIPIYYHGRRAGKSKMRPFFDTYLFTKRTLESFYELKIKKYLNDNLERGI